MKISAWGLLAAFLVRTHLCSCTAAPNRSGIAWSQLQPLPDSRGVAAPFSGVSNGALLVAGGANFPEKMPWEGDTKVWHDGVYALESPSGSWELVGRLPGPLAYGVSAVTNGGLLCIGGSDAEVHHREVFELHLDGGKLVIVPRDPLPVPLALAAGAVAGNAVYVACGATEPGEKSASNRVFMLPLGSGDSHWSEIEPVPGKPRILPVVAAIGDTFYLVGGAALETVNGKVARTYLHDAWSYKPGRGWRQLADLPQPTVAAPSPAPVADDSFFILGGDDGSLVGFQPVEKHPGFPGNILAYDAVRNTWRLCGKVPAPRATVPVAVWRNMFVIPSGEMRPGVRSPEVWAARFEKGE